MKQEESEKPIIKKSLKDILSADEKAAQAQGLSEEDLLDEE
jgi:hypothetical protein